MKKSQEKKMMMLKHKNINYLQQLTEVHTMFPLLEDFTLSMLNLNRDMLNSSKN